MSSRFRSTGIGEVARVLTAKVSGIPVALEVAGPFDAHLIDVRR